MEQSAKLRVPLNYSNTVLMPCNKASIKGLLDCCDNDLENITENTAWNLEHNLGKLQEILI